MEYKHKVIQTEIKILEIFSRFCEENALSYFLYGGTLLGAERHGGMIPWDDDIDLSMPRYDFEKMLLIAKSLPDNVFLDFYTTNSKYWLPFAKIRLKNTIYLESFLQNTMTNSEFWIDIFPLDYVCDDVALIQKRKKKIWNYSNFLAIKSGIPSQKKESFIRISLKLISIFVPRRFLISKRNKIMISRTNQEYYVNYGSKYDVKKQIHPVEKYYPYTYIEFESKKYRCPRDKDYILRKIYGVDYMQLPPIEKRINHCPILIKFEDGEVIRFDNKK